MAGIRAGRQLDPSNARIWLIGGGFAVVLAAIVTLYLRIQARLAAIPPPEPAR